MKTVALASICVLAAIGAGCGKDSPTSPTPAAVVIEPSTRLFTGVLPKQGSAFFSYTAAQAGTATAMLASLTVGGTGPAVVVPVGLGIGIPAGTGCALLTSTTTTPALTSQVSWGVSPGVYCVGVFDPGTLANDLSFAVRIIHP